MIGRSVTQSGAHINRKVEDGWRKTPSGGYALMGDSGVSIAGATRRLNTNGNPGKDWDWWAARNPRDPWVNRATGIASSLADVKACQRQVVKGHR